MANIHFEEHRMEVEALLNEAITAFLYEAAGEFQAQTKRNMDTLTGDWYTQQKNAWEYQVDENKGEATIGNPLESALWTEFGTGEYAIHGDGRKGYWIYVKNNSSGSASVNPKSYTKEEARKIVAMMRSDGLDAHYTKGQKAKRPLQHAFDTKKESIIRRLGTLIEEKFT